MKANELDNKKMWASLIKHTTVSYGNLIKKALKDQGFEFDGDEIVPIEQDFKVEAGKFYVCIKPCLGYTVGKIYEAVTDGFIITDTGVISYNCNTCLDCFRLATEEEIASSSQNPKFKIGDWVVDKEGIPYKIIGIHTKDGGRYYVFNNNSYSFAFSYPLKLWTINDAKDGDVLEFEDHGRLVIGILSFVNKTTGKVDVSCLLEDDKFKVGIFYNLDTVKPHPATKEQRDLLFNKMHDSGYEWDADKKELKKIEEQEWEPQPGDKFRKKGTDSPLYYLCSKREDGIHFGFVQEMENGAAGGEISIFTLKTEYELVERLGSIEEFFKKEFYKALNRSVIIESNNQERLSEFEDSFIHIYQGKYPCELNEKDLDYCIKAAKELLSVARKQFVKEASEWLKGAGKYCWYDPIEDNEGFNGDRLIEDFKKEFDKGE